MKKIYLFILTLFLIGSVFAIPSVSINSIEQKDRSGNVISSASNVGDQIFVDANVYDPDTLYDLKKAYLSWDSSWVDCYSRNVINNTDVNYKCILTVTPFMSQPTNVYFTTESRIDGINSVLLGNFDFNGEPFPQPSFCYTEDYCVRYEYNIVKQCTSYYTDNCEKYTYHKEKQCTSYNTKGKCTRYKTIKVNEGCAKYRDDMCKKYKINNVKGDCIKFSTRNICTSR
jgi:hypothetical protein